MKYKSKNTTLDVFLQQIEHIEENTTLYEADHLGYPWYQAAIESINNSISKKITFPSSSNTLKIRAEDYKSKIKLLNTDIDYLFIVKSKQYRLFEGNPENYLFYDVLKHAQNNNKKFLIFDVPENSTKHDLCYLKSTFHEYTIPYECYQNDNSDHIKHKVIKLNQYLKELFSSSKNKCKYNCEICNKIAQTYINMTDTVVLNKLTIDNFLRDKNVSAVIGSMGTHFMPGLNNNYSIIEIGHGIDYNNVTDVSRRIYTPNVRQYIENNFSVNQCYALMLNNPNFNKTVIGPSLYPQKNIFRYGIPELRHHAFSTNRINSLKLRLDISNQLVLLIATSNGCDNDKILDLISHINNRLPNATILVRQHPTYDMPLVSSHDLRYHIVTDDNLYDILFISDIVISPPSSLIHEASIFTDSTILYTRSIDYSNIDYNKLYPCKYVTNINDTNNFVNNIQKAIENHTPKPYEYHDDSESEIDKVFTTIANQTHNRHKNSKSNNKNSILNSNTKKKIFRQDLSLHSFVHNYNDFINIKLSQDNIDIYIIRHAITRIIEKHSNLFRGTVLDVGCGQMPYKNLLIKLNSNIDKYIGMDFAKGKYAIKASPDIIWDGISIPLDSSSVDCAMATEVLEHCHAPLTVLKEIHRVLKPTGIFFFTIPFLWPIHDAPHDHYRYTPFAMEKLLSDAGFENIQIEAMGGWNASLAQMIGLWLKRAPMPEHVRQKATADLFPFYQQLINTDIIPSDYRNNTMAIGFSGIARKRSFLCKQHSSDPKNSRPEIDTESSTSAKSNTKLTIIQSGFPSLSATFIIDQMTGLIDRGVNIENWATYDPKLSSIHPSILSYDLLSKTRYLKIVPRDSVDDSKWVEEFLKTNQIVLNEVGTIHVHYGSNFVDLEPLFKILSNHIVVSFHGHDASRYFKQHGDNCYKYLFERANIITTPSYVMRDELIKRGCDPNKILVHRYGINLNDFNSDSRTFNSKKIIFLTVGRLVEKKGIEFSIKAFSKICNKIDCEYRIIGSGPLSKKLNDLVHYLKISDKVKFLGEHNKDVVIREMKSADIFVLTSVTASDGDQEGVPVSLTEAQAMGLPVVSSFHSGIPELVLHQKTGLLSGEKDIPEIAKNMLFLAQHNDIRKEFSVQSRKRVLSEFNIEFLNDIFLNYIQNNNQEINFKIAQNNSRTQSILENNLIHIQWCDKISLYAQHINSHSELKRNCSPTLSVIIISWRLHPHTVKSFHILKEQQNLNFEIIFVNNGAKPGEFDCLTPYINTYVRLNSNSGAYLARNIGSAFAHAPILFFLDDDAIPAENIIESHLKCYKKYDVIAVRGVCQPKTNNPLNQLAKHYYLGPNPFPVYADIEGNTSYLASAFYKAGGWDDEIRFGGGGVDLSRRLIEIDPDMRKQIYSPDPVIFHDYAADHNHLAQKIEKQELSRSRLRTKHPDFDNFLARWKKLRGKEELLILRPQ